MRIDFHTHAFPDKIAAATIEKLAAVADTNAFSDGTYAGLSASSRAAGLDLSIVLPVATHPRQVTKINDTAAAVNERTAQTGLFSFGGIHPDTPDYREELSRIQALGLKGVKLHPPYQGVEFDDPRYLRIIDRACELGLIVLTHAGIDIGIPGPEKCTVAHIRRVIDQLHPDRLVLAHMGGWMLWDDVERELCGLPVYLDTAFSLGTTRQGRLQMLTQEQFLRIVRAHGADRVLFGTDSPWSSQQESLTAIEQLPLTPSEREQILGENARRLLQLA